MGGTLGAFTVLALEASGLTAENIDEVLLVGSILDLLIDHPPAAPKLDHDDLVALRASLPSDFDAAVATEVSAHLLDRAELEAYRPDLIADC